MICIFVKILRKMKFKRLNIKEMRPGEGINLGKAFIEAAKTANVKKAKLLIERGVDVQIYNDKAIKEAMKRNHHKMVKFLICSGANIYSHELLDIVFQKNNMEMVKYFFGIGVFQKIPIPLSATTDLNVIKFVVENASVSPFQLERSLYSACIRGDLPIARYLIEKGACTRTVTECLQYKNEIKDFAMILLDDEIFKLRKKFIFNYLVLKSASPKVSIGKIEHCLIPKSFILKCIYLAQLNEIKVPNNDEFKVPPLEIIALAEIMGLTYDINFVNFFDMKALVESTFS